MFSTDGVEHVVHAASIGFIEHDAFEIFAMTVDGASAVAFNHVVLRFGRGRPHLGHASPSAQLQSSGTHASRATVDEDGVVGLQVSQMVEHVMRRHVGHRGGRRRGEVDVVGQRNHSINRADDEAGLPARTHSSNHALADLQPFNALSEGVDDAADFVPGCERKGWSRLIEPQPHEQIGKVDASIGHFDADLAGARLGRVHRLRGHAPHAPSFGNDHTTTHVQASSVCHVWLSRTTRPSRSSAMR